MTDIVNINIAFAIASGLAACGVYQWWLSSRSTVRRLPLPPGPRVGWFGSGLPHVYPWHTYEQWAKNYGDVVYVYVLGNPIIVLNSWQAATELLDKRSHRYSSRPQRTMVVELMGWDWLFSSMPYGSRWRRHRSLFHQYFQPSLTSSYYPVTLKETHTTLRNLLSSPEAYAHHLRRTAAAIVMNISYGHQVADGGDVYVTIADKALQGLGMAGIFGTYLVDYFPFLKYMPSWMPGAGFKRKAYEWRKFALAMVEQPFQAVKERIAKGDSVPCIVQQELDKWMQTERDPEHEQIIRNVAAITFAAGADTTVSALLSFVLAVISFPEIQEKAQQEIDRVVGSERLPSFEDKGSLPYIDCIVLECLRWHPVTPLGLVHYVTEDDEYKGFFIPKGTSVFPNVWAILHDENFYPKPNDFIPERFSDPEANERANINKPPQPAFGFGRRVCPGRFLAFDEIWISVASILSVYSIKPPLDTLGNEVHPPLAYTSSLLSRPPPFECRFIPRSEAAIALIKQTAPEST